MKEKRTSFVENVLVCLFVINSGTDEVHQIYMKFGIGTICKSFLAKEIS
jgi:hypothetical protein